MKRKTSPKQLEALKLIAEGRFYPTLVSEEDGWHARWAPLENAWVDEYVRSASISPISEDAEDQHHETLHDAWIMALRSRTGLIRWDDAECHQFAAELKDWSGDAEEDVEARRRLKFSLLMPSAPEGKPHLQVVRPHDFSGLKALGQATYLWGALRGLRHTEDPKVLTMELTLSEAESFSRQGAAALVSAGYEVEGVIVETPITAAAEIGESKTKSSVKLIVRVAGESVTAAEIKFLLDQGSSLVFFRDHWIEVDRNILKCALRALERCDSRNVNFLAFAMGIGHYDRLEIDELKSHGWIRGLVHELELAGKGVLPECAAIPELKCDLRDYQRRGVEWLNFMSSHGFGALLADDMGLGKTVETIAWILANRAERAPCLVVTPLSLVANWEHELNRFAPSLSFKEVRVVNYHRLVREYSVLSSIKWASIVVDEAQFVKNSKTQAARAIRALSPRNRIALTGTPIENSVEDIWSLEDFLNPGFLGDRASFRERFLRPIMSNPESTIGARLKHALEPFVLRRLKTDPKIAAELGEKRELREYCTLDPKARRDYEAALTDFQMCEHTAGDALALLSQLKQICDGENKLLRLFELLETIFANGESALVFTQYTRIGSWLKSQLDARFKTSFPYLHGALSMNERERQIQKFNRGAALPDFDGRPSAFVVSLRAGGFGLNLTKATHVIHFDRWWNPAVEDQATDRAHRIGQAENVWVHLFITTGTLEEHIDEILRRKQSLKGLIEDGEAFYNAVKLSQ